MDEKTRKEIIMILKMNLYVEDLGLAEPEGWVDGFEEALDELLEEFDIVKKKTNGDKENS